MSYLALYRKYRPKTFDEVIGQEHIVRALKNQIKNDEISHAYLFTGTRGTGKTSIAKIFARAINCMHPNDASPCGKCEVCQGLLDASNMDILEIDAASNNRVDEIRELRENVKYLPVVGKYKVYIIDEVHMLTDSAFNALLKTLEEPPAHVVFILATTEVQKLPATILSRCMRFDFKLVDNDKIVGLLAKIFDENGIKYESEALNLIAKLGKGSVRDSLSLADMCVAYTNKSITYSAVTNVVGVTNPENLSGLVSAMLSHDAKGVLDAAEELYSSGKNMGVLAGDVTEYLRGLVIVKTCKNYAQILKLPESILSTMVDIASKFDAKDMLYAMRQFADLEQDFRFSDNPRTLFEITALDVCATSVSSMESLERRIADLENKLKGVRP